MSASNADLETGEALRKLDALSQEAGFDAERLRDHVVEAERLIAADHGASRAAMLTQIDLLARRGRRGLVFLIVAAIGVSGFLLLSASSPQNLFISLAFWWGLLALTLIRPLTLLQRYHRGGKILRQPFTWRADYTAELAVLGFAFGSFAILMPLSSQNLEMSFIIVVAVIGAGIIATLFHANHRMAVASLMVTTTLPGLLTALFLITTMNSPNQLFFMIWAIASISCGVIFMALWHRARTLSAQALLYYPRRETRHIEAGIRTQAAGYNPYKLKMLAKTER